MRLTLLIISMLISLHLGARINNIEHLQNSAVVPYTSSIVAHGNSRLSLAQHHYDISLQVYMEEGSTIEHFYTIIQEPYTAIKWDISNLSTNTWVELTQSFELEAAANNSRFEIKIPNNPEYGGGQGTFLI